jgi:hypothetical protein
MLQFLVGGSGGDEETFLIAVKLLVCDHDYHRTVTGESRGSSI